MTRILVFSDSHGRFSAMVDAIERSGCVDAVCYTGDGIDDIEVLASLLPAGTPVYAVRGNCDFFSETPTTRTVTVAGKRIFLLHGHTLDVAWSRELLLQAARQQQADIVLFGHTHHEETWYEDGIFFLNPGAVKDGKWGVVDISDAGIVCLLEASR